MPNRNYVHPSFQMNFYWKLRMDCFVSMQGFHPKEGLSWKKYSLPSWFELRIVPMAHRVTHPLSFWGYEHSWVALSGDQTTHSMSMKFCSDSSQKPCSSLISPRSSIVPSSNESYDHLRVSPHRCSLGWLCLVLLFIISMQGSLLHLCTNLAAWTTINQQMVVKMGLHHHQ